MRSSSPESRPASNELPPAETLGVVFDLPPPGEQDVPARELDRPVKFQVDESGETEHESLGPGERLLELGFAAGINVQRGDFENHGGAFRPSLGWSV
jgi:hypothetical protein